MLLCGPHMEAQAPPTAVQVSLTPSPLKEGEPDRTFKSIRHLLQGDQELNELKLNWTLRPVWRL